MSQQKKQSEQTAVPVQKKHQPTPAPQIGAFETEQLAGFDAPTSAGILDLPESNALTLKQAQVVQMQKQQGNAYVQRFLQNRSQPASPPSKLTIPKPPQINHIVQPKLSVNEPDDQYEKEADAVADAVMRMPASDTPSPIDDKNNTDQTNLPTISKVQRKEDGVGGHDVAPDMESRIASVQSSGGKPLPDSERELFEPRMGADFSNVRIHDNETAVQTARELNAKAYTVGSDIVFNKGEYSPGSESGRTLLAHELTHTIQQGSVSLQRKEITVPLPPEPEPIDMSPSQEKNLDENQQNDESDSAITNHVSEHNDSFDTQNRVMQEDTEKDSVNYSNMPVANDDTNSLELNSKEDVSLEKGMNTEKQETDEGISELSITQHNEDSSLDPLVEEPESKVEEQTNQIGELTSLAQGAVSEAISSRDALINVQDEAQFVFEPSQEEIPTGLTTFIERKEAEEGDINDITAQANEMVSGFTQNLTSNATPITLQADEVPETIASFVTESTALVTNAVETNHSIITNTIAQVKTQMESEAMSTKTEIQACYSATIADIEASMESGQSQIDTDFQTASEKLTNLRETKYSEIEEAFQKAQNDLLSAGQTSASVAMAKGEVVISEYESKQYPEPGRLDGEDFYERKRTAAINAAQSTAQGYHDEFLKNSEDLANQIELSKPDAKAEINKKIQKANELLAKERDTSLTKIQTKYRNSLTQAENSLNNQLQSVSQALQMTQQSLASLEKRLQRELIQTSEQQICAIEESGQQIIVEIETYITEVTESVKTGSSKIVEDLKGQNIPHLETLNFAVEQAQKDSSTSLNDHQASVNEQIELAQETLAQQGTQAVEVINNMGEQSIEQTIPIASNFTVSMSNILNNANSTFDQIQTAHVQAMETSVSQTKQKFEQTINDTEVEINELIEPLKEGLIQLVVDFQKGEGGLESTLAEVEDKCRSEAQAAANKVQPAWKRVVASVLTVVVTVVVAVAIVALIASGVGLVGGLLLATGIGALGGLAKGMLENWSEGEDPFKDIWKHTLIGSIEGVLQFIGGNLLASSGLLPSILPIALVPLMGLGKRIIIEGAKFAHGHPISNQLIEYYGYHDPKEDGAFHLSADEMVELGVVADIQVAPGFNEAYNDLIANGGGMKFISLVDWGDEENGPTASTHGTLGDFTINYSGMLVVEPSENDEYSWRFDGNMSFYDKWDFDEQPEGEREKYASTLTWIGRTFLPGNSFEINSDTVPVSQATGDKEGNWKGTGVEGIPSRLSKIMTAFNKKKDSEKGSDDDK